MSNCVWASKESNQLKGRFDARNNAVKASFSKEELSILESVLKSNLEEQLNNIYKFVKGEATVTIESKDKHEILSSKDENNNSDCQVKNAITEIEPVPYQINNDVELAQTYSTFATHCKDHVDFLLSFNEYKKIMSRKQCQLSMQKFDEEHKKSLFVIDKTKPIDVKNLLVVDLKLRHQLDTFIGK